MKNIKLYDVVRSARQIGKIPAHTKGTVLIIYASGQDYEVEFVDETQNTLAVETVSAKDIRLVTSPNRRRGLGLTSDGRE